MNHQQKEAVKQLREEGQSYYRIADLLFISENTVKSYCRRNNLSGVASIRDEQMSRTYCRQCGATLKQTLGKKQKQYCSDQCRMMWWNSHPIEVNRKNIQTFVCQTCGRNFIGYGKRERKYCSHACYGKAKRVWL